HGQSLSTLRELAEKREKPLAILQDLAGPKVRIGDIAAGTITLKRGQCIRLTLDSVPGDQSAISLPVEPLFRAVEVGDRLLADDGNVTLRIFDRTETDLFARVIDGGVLTSRKGISAPGVSLDIPAVTQKD